MFLLTKCQLCCFFNQMTSLCSFESTKLDPYGLKTKRPRANY